MADRVDFKVGDKVLLQGKVIEYVEPRNRGVGVTVYIGRTELPLWVNAADLLHQDSMAALALPAKPPQHAPITEDEFQEAFNLICGETPEDLSESDTKRLVDWINSRAGASATPAPARRNNLRLV